MIIQRTIYLSILLFFAVVNLSCKKDAPEPSLTNEPAKLHFYSVVASPTTSESITLKNNSGGTLDVSGWTIGDSNAPNAYSIPANSILTQGQFITFSHTTLGFQINDSGEVLYLKHDGVVVDTWRN